MKRKPNYEIHAGRVQRLTRLIYRTETLADMRMFAGMLLFDEKVKLYSATHESVKINNDMKGANQVVQKELPHRRESTVGRRDVQHQDKPSG